MLLAIHDKLAALRGRPLRVLDLGANEDFAHRLAARGAVVHRDDADASGDFDLVLALGLGDLAIDDLSHLLSRGHAQNAGAVLLESPVPDAAPDEDRPQPPVWHMLRGLFAFVHEVGLAAGQRQALWFASNRHWFLSGVLGTFDQYKSESHSAARGTYRGTRRYYLGAGLLVKHYSFDDAQLRERNLTELRSEIGFLRQPPKGFAVPPLLLAGERREEGFIVRRAIEGRPLLDIMRAGEPYGAESVLHDVLTQLATLERAGLYHRDVRTWNVIVAPNGRATVIDFGTIASAPTDCTAPHNLFVAFLIFACEVSSGEANRVHVCLPRFNPDNLPPQFRAAFWSMLQSPPATWRFQRLLDIVSDPGTAQRLPETSRAGLSALLEAADEIAVMLDEHLAWREAEIMHRREQLRQAGTHAHAMDLAVASRDADIAALHRREAALNAELAARNTEIAQLAAREAHLERQIAGLKQSTSGRVTEPLRLIRRTLDRALRLLGFT
jgi:O-antigen chain-terminating methyltransferase